MAGTRSATLAQTTFVTGFWPVAGNTKYPAGHYDRTLARTMAMLRGGRLMAFYELPETAETFTRLAARHGIALELRYLALEALPSWPASAGLLRACEATDIDYWEGTEHASAEKCIVHYRRDLQRSGPEVYRRLAAIWTGRFGLMRAHVIPENPFGTDWFCWVDASLSRVNRLRANWDFTRVAYDDPSVLHHYGHAMIYRGERLRISGGFGCATAPLWEKVGRLFDARLEAAGEEAYGHDDETLLHDVLTANPELFRSLGGLHGLRRRTWAKRWMRVWPGRF